jgi:hypothetical protein
MQVNDLVPWLKKEGRKKGWYRIQIQEAYKKGTEGHPTIAIWENPEGDHGHVSIVRPGNPDSRGPAIAQAGSLVLDAKHLKLGFHDEKFEKAIEFWYHE